MVRLKKYIKKPDIVEEEKNNNIEKPRDEVEVIAAINNKTLTYESFPMDIIGNSDYEEDN